MKKLFSLLVVVVAAMAVSCCGKAKKTAAETESAQVEVVTETVVESVESDSTATAEASAPVEESAE